MNRAITWRHLPPGFICLGVTFAMLGRWFVGFAEAGEVGPSAFTDAAVIENYDDLGLSLDNAAPLVVGHDTYNSDNGVVRWSAAFGPFIGRSGGALLSDTGDGFLNIELGHPARRAGLYVGTLELWTAEVSFYDESDSLLGTVSTGSFGGSHFTGWQADSGLIKRIHVADTLANGTVIAIDDFIQEIPEPTSGCLATLALLALAINHRPFRPRAGGLAARFRYGARPTAG